MHIHRIEGRGPMQLKFIRELSYLKSNLFVCIVATAALRCTPPSRSTDPNRTQLEDTNVGSTLGPSHIIWFGDPTNADKTMTTLNCIARVISSKKSALTLSAADANNSLPDEIKQTAETAIKNCLPDNDPYALVVEKFKSTELSLLSGQPPVATARPILFSKLIKAVAIDLTKDEFDKLHAIRGITVVKNQTFTSKEDITGRPPATAAAEGPFAANLPTETVSGTMIESSANCERYSWARDRINPQPLPIDTDPDMVDNRRDGDISIPSVNAGKDVDVYVFDSGVYREHEEFVNVKWGAGRNFIEIDGVLDDADTTDIHGHGTSITSLIAGHSTGVAPNATIHPVRVLNSARSSTLAILTEAFEWLDHFYQFSWPY